MAEGLTELSEGSERKGKKFDKAKWIGIGIAAVTLIIVYLAYRKSQSGGPAPIATGMPTGTNAQLPAATSGSDLSGISAALQSLAGSESQLAASLAPASAAGGTPASSVDYSALGPYANFLSTYGYQAELGRAPDESGLLYWEQKVEGWVSAGMAPLTAEQNALMGIEASPEAQSYNAKLSAGTYKSGGTMNAFGFFVPNPTGPATPGGGTGTPAGAGLFGFLKPGVPSITASFPNQTPAPSGPSTAGGVAQTR